MIPISDLSRIDESLKDRLSEGFRRVLDSGWFLRGSETEEFQERLASLAGVQRAIAVGNGTDALVLALTALGVRPGSRVATVANAGGYTTGATLRLGAVPMFVDVDAVTAQIDATALHALLGSSTPPDVVVMTHLYGQVGDVGRVATLCHEFDIPLVEDCAQSLGAKVDGRPAGSFGTLATASFYPTKNLGGFGDGGAVLASTEELALTIESLAQYGWGERFHVQRPGGMNSRMDEIQAMCLNLLLDEFRLRTERRREICARYSSALGSQRRLIGSMGEDFVGHLAVIVSETRDSDRDRLADEGVQTTIHYPVTDHRQAAWIDLATASLETTEFLADRIFTVPCFPEMTEDEISLVGDRLAAL